MMIPVPKQRQKRPQSKNGRQLTRSMDNHDSSKIAFFTLAIPKPGILQAKITFCNAISDPIIIDSENNSLQKSF